MGPQKVCCSESALKGGKIYGGHLRELGRQNRRKREDLMVPGVQPGELTGPLGLKRKSVSVEYQG